MTARKYSSVATEMLLTAGVDSSNTTISVNTTLGLPASTPYTVVLDPGSGSEEIATVTNRAGGNLTVVRGEDGSTPTTHAIGAKVRHMVTARDLAEPQEHIAATSNVHGVTGDLVGEDSTNTLTNKTISATDNVISDLTAAHIPALDADKITTGTLGTARIPNLSASKITSGTVDVARLPSIPWSSITGDILWARISDASTNGDVPKWGGHPLIVQHATPTVVNGTFWFEIP